MRKCNGSLSSGSGNIFAGIVVNYTANACFRDCFGFGVDQADRKIKQCKMYDVPKLEYGILIMRDDTTSAANASMLEIAVNAVAAEHDLTGFKAVKHAGGYQAICRKCGVTVWVGNNGRYYSLLANKCPSR